MADPISWIFIGLAAAGAVAGGTTAIVQGVQAKNLAEHNAQIAEQNAKAAEQSAEFNADLKRRQFQRLQGQQLAKMGGTGSTMEGSPLDIIATSAAENEMDILNTLYKGKIQAWNFENDAGVERYKGDTAKTQGLMQGTSTILSGLGSAGMQANKAGLFAGSGSTGTLTTDTAGYKGSLSGLA